MLEFEGGTIGTVAACQVCPGRKNRISLEIYGREKSLAWSGEEPNVLWIGSRFEPNSLLLKDPSLAQPMARDLMGAPGGLAEGYLDTWRAIFSVIYDHIKGNEYPEREDAFPTFAEGYRIQVLVEAMLKSNAENRWVDVKYEV